MGRVDRTNKRWIPLLVAFVVALSVVTFTNPAPAQASGPNDFEVCLLQELNEARTEAGVDPLQMVSNLVPDVRAWSQWMSSSNDLQHMPASRRANILPDQARAWGENVARHGDRRMSSCEPIHRLWMNSPGHRANMLNPKVRFVAIGAYAAQSGWWATQLFFDRCGEPCADEIFFYRADGLHRYYEVRPDATIGSPINKGDGYTNDWDSITAVDLDGDGRDEMFFYKKNGLYRYYDVNPDGALGAPIAQGNDYSKDWDSITAVDLDGDGQDEMFFYKKNGLYRYYDVNPDGTLDKPINKGANYTNDWDSITAVDLDGDGRDEMFFYKKNGLYRYYDVNPDGTLGKPIRAGSDYTSGWDSITAVDLDGDGQDELNFYRSDGLYRYYDVNPDGRVGKPISGGSSYTNGWNSITAVDFR